MERLLTDGGTDMESVRNSLESARDYAESVERELDDGSGEYGDILEVLYGINMALDNGDEEEVCERVERAYGVVNDYTDWDVPEKVAEELDMVYTGLRDAKELLMD